MNNQSDSQEELSEFIPNQAGIPCQTAASEGIRKEHNRWKNAVDKRKNKRKSTSSYWEKMSSCAAL